MKFLNEKVGKVGRKSRTLRKKLSCDESPPSKALKAISRHGGTQFENFEIMKSQKFRNSKIRSKFHNEKFSESNP